MLVLKRLVIWMIEMPCEVFLLGLGCLLFGGYDKTRGISKELLAYVTWIGLFSFSTAYLLTTAVSRAMWRDLRPWSYPVVATVLFLIHSQVFFAISGGSTASERISFQAAGACVVLACTLAGTFVLRRWVAGQPMARLRV